MANHEKYQFQKKSGYFLLFVKSARSEALRAPSL